jgi:hypothetical protein
MSHHHTHWIRRSTRFAIYARDGFKCVVCDSYKRLSLDHIDPDGSNEHTNLVTLCGSCNSSKKRTPLLEWRPAAASRVLLAVSLGIDRELGRRLHHFYKENKRVKGRPLSIDVVRSAWYSKAETARQDGRVSTKKVH